MKKIALALMLITTIPTYAGTTMCAANDTVAVVLDPSIGLTNKSSNNTTGTWWVWGPYGTVYGTSAILNDNKGFAYIRTVKHLHDTDNDGNDHLVTGGERYGKYCWCKLTHPVSSVWSYVHNWVYASMTVSSLDECLGLCARAFHENYSGFRSALIGSISN